MLPPHLPRPAGHLPLALGLAASAAIICISRGSAGGRSRRRRRPKPKSIAFPPPPLRRLVSTSVRRILLPLPRPLGGGWPGRRGRRRKAPAEDAVLLVLSLAFGGRLAAIEETWRASGLGQALGIWAAVFGGARRKRRKGLRRLAALLLGIVFCAFVSHFRGAALLEGLGKSGSSGRKLARIFLH